MPKRRNLFAPQVITIYGFILNHNIGRDRIILNRLSKMFKIGSTFPRDGFDILSWTGLASDYFLEQSFKFKMFKKFVAGIQDFNNHSIVLGYLLQDERAIFANFKEMDLEEAMKKIPRIYEALKIPGFIKRTTSIYVSQTGASNGFSGKFEDLPESKSTVTI